MGDISNVSAIVAATQKSQAPTTYDALPTGDMFDTMIQVTISDPSPEDFLPVIGGAPAAPRTETFELHKGVLVYYSDYSRASLYGNFEEAQDKHIHLSSEDVDFETFRMFRGWLYTRVVHDNGSGGEDLSYATIIRLWTFADVYLIPMLGNLCIDLFIQKYGKHRKHLDSAHISLIFSGSVENSLIRRLVVDLVSSFRKRRSGRIVKERTQLPRDFLEDLVKVLWVNPSMPRYLQRKWLADIDSCKYHEHPEGISCVKPASDSEED